MQRTVWASPYPRAVGRRPRRIPRLSCKWSLPNALRWNTQYYGAAPAAFEEHFLRQCRKVPREFITPPRRQRPAKPKVLRSYIPRPDCSWSIGALLDWNRKYYGADEFLLVSKFRFDCGRKKAGAFTPPSRRPVGGPAPGSSARGPATSRASSDGVRVKGAPPIVDSRLDVDRCTGTLPMPECSWSLEEVLAWNKRYYGAAVQLMTDKYNIDCVPKRKGVFELPSRSPVRAMVTPAHLQRARAVSATDAPTAPASSPALQLAVAVAPVAPGGPAVGPGDGCGPTGMPVSLLVWYCSRPDGTLYYSQPAAKKVLDIVPGLTIDAAIEFFK